jgi:hypothetical protein
MIDREATGDAIPLSSGPVPINLILDLAGGGRIRSKSCGFARKTGWMCFSPSTAIITRSFTAFRAGLQCTTVPNGCRWLFAATLSQTQQHQQVMHHHLEHLGLQPTLGLLIHRFPRRQVMRHHPLLRPSADHPPQPVEHFSQVVVPLRHIFPHQPQIRRHKRPFIITHISWVCFPVHHSSLSIVHSRL